MQVGIKNNQACLQESKHELRLDGDKKEWSTDLEVPENECLAAGLEVGSAHTPEAKIKAGDWDYTPCGCVMWPLSDGRVFVDYDRVAVGKCKSESSTVGLFVGKKIGGLKREFTGVQNNQPTTMAITFNITTIADLLSSPRPRLSCCSITSIACCLLAKTCNSLSCNNYRARLFFSIIFLILLSRLISCPLFISSIAAFLQKFSASFSRFCRSFQRSFLAINSTTRLPFSWIFFSSTCLNDSSLSNLPMARKSRLFVDVSSRAFGIILVFVPLFCIIMHVTREGLWYGHSYASGRFRKHKV